MFKQAFFIVSTKNPSNLVELGNTRSVAQHRRRRRLTRERIAERYRSSLTQRHYEYNARYCRCNLANITALAITDAVVVVVFDAPLCSTTPRLPKNTCSSSEWKRYVPMNNMNYVQHSVNLTA